MKDGPQLYLIFGDDEFPVSVKAKAVVEKLVPPAEQTFGLEAIDARSDTVDQAVAAVHSCTEALQTSGFLGAGKVVWFKDVNFLSDTVVGRSKRVKEAVAGLVGLIKSGLPTGQTLVIAAAKVDKRSALYKTCKDSGELHEFSVPAKSYKADEQARAYVVSQAKDYKLKMGRDAIHAFVERAGTDSRQITNEMSKLALFLGDRHEVKPKDIADIVCASRELVIWDLGDAVGDRDLGKGLKTLRQLLFQKESPVGMIVSLQNRLNDLMLFREALDRGWLALSGSDNWRTVDWHVPDDLEDVFVGFGTKDPRKMHPYRAARLATQARRFSLAELSRFRKLAIRAHEQLVSSDVSQPLVLELLLIRLAGVKQR